MHAYMVAGFRALFYPALLTFLCNRGTVCFIANPTPLLGVAAVSWPDRPPLFLNRRTLHSRSGTESPDLKCLIYGSCCQKNAFRCDIRFVMAPIQNMWV
ncbi:hypothetical protein VFPPC_16388 [Pochonia chlamydosporia 170]|uniref:Secreted protein n=1 Tax=Pochonia chlamydosporia 170 TaxID=1380566 RepID=A0A179FBW6_METCM|nr:hypothetical protein VFPPC_16388 [Pochonia chlamydosporia 170]OAQ62847.1 hypothetical protein VFPPC_16388 [Pochonia chlamydosporia 170]